MFHRVSDEKKGAYIKVQNCMACDWFRQPPHKYLPSLPHEVCPSCGEQVKFLIGRYIYSEHKTLFGRWTEYTGFEEKVEAPEPPKEPMPPPTRDMCEEGI